MSSSQNADTAPVPAGRASVSLPRIYCLPPAGCGANAFRHWPDRVAPGTRVCPILLPGRETRLREQPFTDMAALVEAVAPEVDTVAPGVSVLLGHSFGALAAFETARLLRRAGSPPPALLVVLGAAAPPLPVRRRGAEGMVDFLRRVGGMPEEALAHPKLLRLIMPALRADVGLCEEYEYADEPPLDTPILALAGNRDALVPVEAVAAWEAQTTAGFRFEVLDGDHFFPGRSDEFFAFLDEACRMLARR